MESAAILDVLAARSLVSRDAARRGRERLGRIVQMLTRLQARAEQAGSR